MDIHPVRMSRPFALVMSRSIFLTMALVLASVATHAVPAEKLVNAPPGHNPLIWADVPDMAIIRVGKSYYMSSTTMHMSPGLPIMKSTDLVNWQMASYAYKTLADNDALNLENGKNAYGEGSWVAACVTTTVCSMPPPSPLTRDAPTSTLRVIQREALGKGPVSSPRLVTIVFFSTTTVAYMVFGSGRITLVEMKADLSGIKPGGVNKVIVDNVNAVFGADQGGLKGEGSQIFKVNGHRPRQFGSQNTLG